MPRGQFVSYLKHRKMNLRGCVYHVVRVRDVESETLILESIPVVKDFLELYSNDLLGIPPKRKIDIRFDLFLDIQPISSPPYRTDPVELKELNDQLKEFFDKVFSRSSISLCVLGCCLLGRKMVHFVYVLIIGS